ncbi:inositol polyphosphate multikinase, putative [Schistosoma mansoni]|uniref:inositol polyphosphate multikinase, putative n=1 Tax=Schistosoma mansoni TaxID=6183 RepID=UPI00022C8473|nr:inositol polyphosphate multikinase, putative [Schistosoma mansoni]|eukprot:XP_018645725.1 inositol polyphosphate multikinase, putative [Schistosoma mansoni]
MVFGDVPPLPTCTESYAFQVAGHSRENASSFEILRDKSKPIIYKSLQDRERGMREVMFYQSVFSPDASEALKRLRQFIPTYYGVFQCPGTKAYYMALTDLVADFKQPNICDFKMGTVTYFPGSSQDKISREELKYIWRRKLGFVLSGMQISDTKNHCLIKFPKAFGRTLTPEQVYSIGIKPFLGTDPTYSVKLAQNYIIQLGRILNWYVEYGAKELTFCRSSILLIHESLPSTTTNNEYYPSKSCFASSSAPTTTIINNNNNSNTHHTSCTTRNPTLNNQLVNNSPNFPFIHKASTGNGNNGNSSCHATTTTTTSTTVHAQVYLIDFAHWSEKHYSPLFNNDIEHNKNYWTCELTNGFRHGLENLIKLMHYIVNNESAICINS